MLGRTLRFIPEDKRKTRRLPHGLAPHTWALACNLFKHSVIRMCAESQLSIAHDRESSIRNGARPLRGNPFPLHCSNPERLVFVSFRVSVFLFKQRPVSTRRGMLNSTCGRPHHSTICGRTVLPQIVGRRVFFKNTRLPGSKPISSVTTILYVCISLLATRWGWGGARPDTHAALIPSRPCHKTVVRVAIILSTLNFSVARASPTRCRSYTE